MTWTAMNSRIVTVLQGVSGIGQVHSFQRYTVEPDVFRTLYSSNGVINGWTVSRDRTTEERQGMRQTDAVAVSRTYHFVIRGYYSLSDGDSTELTFQQLIEDIVEAFRGEVTLNSTAEWVTPLQVDIVEHRTLADYLVHYCELSLEALEYLDP